MTVWGDMDHEVQPLPLDSETAERLLAGRVAPEDAPPGYGPVVRLLDAASADAAGDQLEHEREGVAAFALAVRSSAAANSVSPRRFNMPLALSRARLVAAALAAALVTTTGLAAAGSLPGAAQDVASEMLAKLGVSVPGPNDHAGTNPDERGSSGTAPTAPSAEGKGNEISEIARTTEATGIEKGAVVSAAASEGKSQAGQHGSAASNTNVGGKGVETSERATTTEATGVEKGSVVSTAASEGKSQAGQQGSGSGAGNGSAPATGSNGGGTGTANTASGGQSSAGTSTADAASDGKSSAGSANSGSKNSQKP